MKLTTALLLLAILQCLCCTGCIPKVPDVNYTAVKQAVAEAIQEEAQRRIPNDNVDGWVSKP